MSKCIYKITNTVSFEILDTCNEHITIDELERHWIKTLNTMDDKFGYNKESGGTFKKEVSLETKAKLSKALKGKPGRIWTQEQREHLSKLNSGKNHPQYGKKRSEETLLKMSQAKIGKKIGPYKKRVNHV